MLHDQTPPKGPPAPPEPVPFPDQEGPRALPASDVGIPGTHSADAAAYASVGGAAGDSKPLTERQVRNFFDFLNSRGQNGAEVAPQQPAADESIDASYDYAQTADEHRELGSVVRLESDEIRGRLGVLSLAAQSGMFEVAELVVDVLVQFQQRHFERHQKIISIAEAWAMLAGVVNLALPEES